MGSSYHQLYYHYIWGTYKRLPMIDDEIEEDLKMLITNKIKEKKSELICFGCTNDHVHLIVNQHPAISVSEMIGEIKGYSSYLISNQIHPGCGFRWQGGFGALTVSQEKLVWLTKYVENQKEHHRVNNLHLIWEKSAG